jgi:peptidoglycan hydrolase CwlO-like protein
VLGDDLDNLNEQVYEEAERVDAAQAEAHTWQEEAADANARVERTMNELRARTRELETLKVRLAHDIHG